MVLIIIYAIMKPTHHYNRTPQTSTNNPSNRP